MTWTLRLAKSLDEQMHADLHRPHTFAAERVGVLYTRTSLASGTTLILAAEYRPLDDGDYVDDPTVGAHIGSSGIRKIMQAILDEGYGALHVHSHGGLGRPRFSGVDLRELPGLIRSFRAVNRDMPHGALLLSADQCNALVWLPGEAGPSLGGSITIVGFPTVIAETGGLYA